MNKVRKEIQDSEYCPDWMRFEKKKGKYPSNLLMGFEMEVDPRGDWERFARKVKTLINKHDWLYAKEDGSVDGCEINSHPFNWNWFISKRALRAMGNLSEFAKATRSCGFHIHLSRSFFSQEDIAKMVYFFYGNPDFIESISQRDDMYFCNPSVEDCYTDDDGNCEITPDNARQLADEWEEYGFERYQALNLYPSQTIEIRIFQGTINKMLMRAYLEFAVACAVYIKQTKMEKISVHSFKKFVAKKRKQFPMLNRTNLLNACKEDWSAYKSKCA